MTRAEALAEAQRRWGKLYGTVHRDRYSGHYKVGERTSDGLVKWQGSGDSWKAAFLDADRRAA